MDAERLTIFILVLLVLPATVLAAPAVTQLIPQYPRAELVEFEETKEVETHEIMKGSLKKTGGIVEPEKSEFVEGRRIASTWFIPNEERTELVTRFFKDHLSQVGDIVFECSGFDCGSSNHWANRVFRRSILYGPERDQHYFLTRVEGGEGQGWVATYVALRGTRKLYVHTDVIVTNTSPEVGGPGVVRALTSRGKYVVLSGGEARAVDDVVEAMQLEPSYRIAIVGHVRRQRGETVEQAMARSEERAARFRQQVIGSGVNRTRIQSHGVGPLAPVDLDLIERIEVVLISND